MSGRAGKIARFQAATQGKMGDFEDGDASPSEQGSQSQTSHVKSDEVSEHHSGLPFAAINSDTEEYAKPLRESLTYYLVANKYNSNLSWLPEVQTILTNHVRPKLKAMC
ncbi:hypothetical protein EJB05_29632, partial [Eragrostis curvula]